MKGCYAFHRERTPKPEGTASRSRSMRGPGWDRGRLGEKTGDSYLFDRGRNPR